MCVTGNGSGDDELQTKTNEVTVALRRTTALMQTELERSVLSVQMLGTSLYLFALGSHTDLITLEKYRIFYSNNDPHSKSLRNL